MKRREFIAFLGTMAIAAPRAAAAQTSKIYRLGTLTVGPPIASTNGPGAILIKGLAQRGYSLGQNLAYEARGAAGKISQMPNLVQELKAANVDVVVTVGYPAATAAKASGLPTVVATGSGDPVVTGWSRAWRGRAVTSREYPTMQRCFPPSALGS
jgi:putative ABC transport system substrate-binding protein